MIMSEMPFMMAQCASQSCGWIGPAHERKARDGAAEDLYCPTCRGRTRPWVSDLTREQQPLERLKSTRIEATQKTNDACRQARLAHERWRDTQRRTEIARHSVTMLHPDDPQCFAAKEALLVAQGQEAEAAVARAQAMARVKALG
jgi:hypothetical protein